MTETPQALHAEEEIPQPSREEDPELWDAIQVVRSRIGSASDAALMGTLVAGVASACFKQLGFRPSGTASVRFKVAEGNGKDIPDTVLVSVQWPTFGILKDEDGKSGEAPE